MNARKSPHPTSVARRLATLAGWLAFGLLAVTRLGAQTIPITNASFELPPLTTPGSEYSDGATGWSILNGASGAGVFSSTIAGTTPPAHGSQMGFANSGLGLVQTLGTTYTAGMTYTFSGFIGRRGDETNNEDSVGALQLGFFSSGIFQPLASFSVTVVDGATQFSPVTGTYTPGPGQYGATIAIAFANTANAQILFDDVSLTASAIPEPATTAACFGAAMFALAVLRRRRLQPA